MYKIHKKDETYIYCIERITDGAMIPLNTDNTDYQAYLKFLEDNGTPLPADE